MNRLTGPKPEATGPEEEHLTRRARRRDPDAFAELVERYQGKIYGLLYHMTGQAAEAEDLTQDTFLRAWRSLPRFRGQASFYTWIYRIAVNTAINHLRRKRRQPSVSLDDEEAQAENDPTLLAWAARNGPDRQAARLELQKRLNTALRTLSEKHRSVVVLHDIQGWSHEAIARMLHVSAGTVRSRLFYARRLLQVELKDLEP